ncbi:MAG: TonB-dependent receptor [Novosphingobium sp.]|nr:TonB-dependent receptor [Novosphingobium sp.]
MLYSAARGVAPGRTGISRRSRGRIVSSKLKGALLRGGVGLASAALASGHPCLAQQGLPEGRETGTIVVTGSRIRMPEIAGTEAVVSLDARRLDERVLTNVADALNETPGYRGSVTPESAQPSFGQGVNFINAYMLGSNRTLTLVDGRRVVSSNVPTIFGRATPGTQVDLNAIPAILVERVDRVSIGGAPVYGSDAIAGTVNVRLRRELRGLELRGTSGVTAQGDGFRWNLAAAGGEAFAQGRGHVTAALSYDRQASVIANRRAFFRANVANATNPCTVPQAGVCSFYNLVSLLGPPGRSPANDGRVNPDIGFNDSLADGYPGSVLIRDFALPALSPGGVISSGAGAYAYRFAADGSLVPHDTGIVFGAPIPGILAPAASASGGNGLRLFDYVPVTSRLDRLNATLLFDYKLTERLRVFAEGLFYRGEADEPVQLPSFNATLFGGASGALTFRTDNPFLSGQAREQLAALGYGDTFQLSRAHADLADLTGSSESRLYRGVIGLEGSFGIGGRDYGFELSVNYGRNDFTDRGESIDQQAFVNAVNVALVDGRIACTTSPTVTGFPAGQAPIADPACVPLNLFGSGAPSRAALDYVLRDTVAKSRLEQLVINANIGGSPFDIFGNPAAFNLGFEHHAEKAAFDPDAFLRAGSGRSVAIEPTRGSYTLDEVFGEVLLPLITPGNGAVVSRLLAFARIRHVSNSANGSFTAWSAGGTFAPIRDIEFRGNFTRSFRAPSIQELYTPRSGIATGVPDLCSTANIDAGPVPDIRRANCTAFLQRYPAATPLIAATTTVPGLGGGNPGLRNEKADSVTFGAVLRPRFLPGLTLSADWLDIRITDPIASLTVEEIAQGCFDNPAFDTSDPANGNPFCSLIRRDATGQVVSDPQDPAVTTGYVNGKRIRMSGLQASLAYRTGLDRLGMAGSLELGGDLFHLRRRLIDITGVAPARSDGLVGDPAWQGQLRLRYANAQWGLRAHVNYTGKQLLARDNRGPSPNDTREIDHFSAFATVDASLFVNTGEDMRLTLAVTNLFNRVGQEYYGYIVPLSINDALGRRFAISLSKRW